MKRISLQIQFFLALMASVAVAQSILRTENGIVDLLDDERSEGSVYSQQLAAFRLEGEGMRRDANRFLSLGMTGPVTVFEDVVQNRAEIVKNYISEGEWKKALAEVNDGLALNPDNPDLLKVAAYINTVLRDFYMANYYYGRYYRINPKDVNVLSNWAGILIRTFNFSEAMGLIDQALDLNPDHLPSLFYRMIIALTDEDRQVERQDWESLPLAAKSKIIDWITADTDNYRNVLGPKGFRDMCDIAIGTGSADNIDEMAEALKQYSEIKAAVNDEEAAGRRTELLDRLQELGIGGAAIPLQKAVIAYQKGDLEESLSILEDLSRRYPEDAYLLAQYGYLLLQSGSYTKAETVSRRSLELKDALDAKITLASAQLMTGNSDDAWKLIWELARSDPQSLFSWLQDEKPYIRRILADKKRYTQLCNRLGIPPESR